LAALTWLRRTRRRAAVAWARRRRDWRDWKSAWRIESPSSSGLSSRALRIRTLREQYRFEIGSCTSCRRITRWSGGGEDQGCQGTHVGVMYSESSGVLFVARRATPTISHEEQLAANSVEFARHNATRHANQTFVDSLYDNISNLTNWNASKVNASETNASNVNATRKTEL